MLSSLSSFRGVPGGEYPVDRSFAWRRRASASRTPTKRKTQTRPCRRERACGTSRAWTWKTGACVAAEVRAPRRGTRRPPRGCRGAHRGAYRCLPSGRPSGRLARPANTWTSWTATRRGCRRRNAPAASTADANPWVSTSAARSSPINDALDDALHRRSSSSPTRRRPLNREVGGALLRFGCGGARVRGPAHQPDARDVRVATGAILLPRSLAVAASRRRGSTS